MSKAFKPPVPHLSHLPSVTPPQVYSALAVVFVQALYRLLPAALWAYRQRTKPLKHPCRCLLSPVSANPPEQRHRASRASPEQHRRECHRRLLHGLAWLPDQFASHNPGCLCPSSPHPAQAASTAGRRCSNRLSSLQHSARPSTFRRQRPSQRRRHPRRGLPQATLPAPPRPLRLPALRVATAGNLNVLEKPTATRRQLTPILVESQLDVVVLWSPGAKVRVAGVPANTCLSLSSNSREPRLGRDTRVDDGS